MIPDRSYTKHDLWPRSSDSEVIGSLMHAIRKTCKGAAHAQSHADNAYVYTNTHTHRERRRSWCAHARLVPIPPTRDKSAICISALSCMSSFLSFFLSLEGFFICGEFDGGQTSVHVGAGPE